MKPILFSPSATSFTSRGLGTLADATACTVREKLNGVFELSLTLPVTSRHFSELTGGAIIVAKPCPGANPQPFRVCQIRKSGRMQATVTAQHLSYDLDGVPIAPFTAQSAAAAVADINANNITSNPFTLSTDLSVSREMKVQVPTAARALLGDADQSLLRRYGGELSFDGYSVALLERRGADRGCVIAYGKNLVDFDQDENLRELYTGVLPYWSSGDTVVRGDVQSASGSFPFSRVKPVNLSAAFASQPTAAQLNAAGQTYITEEKIGVPTVSITLNAVPVGSHGIDELEELRLGDTVAVRFERLGVQTSARVIGYEFDVLQERYGALSIGDKPETIVSTLSDASRLTRGTIPSGRYGGKSIPAGVLEDNAVTVNTIRNGAVSSTKIEDGAVTTNKVLNQAISYAKLDNTLQVFYTDILAANAIYSGFLHADGSVSAAVVSISNYLSIGGTIYEPKTYTVKDTRNTYTMADYSGRTNNTVYNYNDVAIGTVADIWYRGYLNSPSGVTNTTYNLRVLGPRDAN